MFLSLDGADGDFAAFVDIEAVGLARVHLGVGGAVAVECALADLRVDASWDEESDSDVVIFQFQGFVKPEQGMFGRAICRAQREAEKP